jgi:hypothetical protein
LRPRTSGASGGMGWAEEQNSRIAEIRVMVGQNKREGARGDGRDEGDTGRGALALHSWRGMCYKSRAVKSAAKQELAPVQREAVEVSTQEASPAKVEETAGVSGEDASRYCPVCSKRLESRRCKLICPVCGYYMSCADYY